MKKKIMIFVSVILLVIIGAISWNRYSEKRAEEAITRLQPSDYRVNLKNVKKIDVNGLDKAINGQLSGDYYILIGRPTCPYCRKFSPVVKTLAETHKVYYFDIDANKITPKLRNIVKKQLNIKAVPYITYVYNGKRTSGISDSSASLQRVLKLAHEVN